VDAVAILAVTEGRLGDDRQVRALAAALGGRVRELRRRPGLLRAALERLPGRPPDLGGPWPDLVIVVGGRNVGLAWRIRSASRGRARVVLIGRPWLAPLAAFDLVVTTPQYRLPDAPNVVRNLLPLTSSSASAGPWRERFAAYPRPWIGVLVGGPSGSCAMEVGDARAIAERANALAAASGGSLLVSTSARTPPAVAEALLARIADPALRYRWRAGDPDNPYPAILAHADRFLVTGESASMIAEALATGRPVSLAPPRLRPIARVLVRLSGPWSHGLAARGLWLPARDIRRLHEALAPYLEGGRGPDRLVEIGLERTVERVRMLLGRTEARPAASEAQTTARSA
jgi:hypothetical protein